MNKFMKEAIRLAKIGMDKNNGGPFGAVIVYKDKIIGRGYNQVIATNDPTKHAEIVAISRASKYLKSFDLSKCELYATGEPGPMALAAIAWARIKKVYYGNDHKATSEIGFDDEPIYRFLMKKPSSIKMKLVQIDKQDAYELYKAWKNKSNKTMY